MECYINRKTRSYKSYILVLYSALLQVSTFYLSHHQAVSVHKRKPAVMLNKGPIYYIRMVVFVGSCNTLTIRYTPGEDN